MRLVADPGCDQLCLCGRGGLIVNRLVCKRSVMRLVVGCREI